MKNLPSLILVFFLFLLGCRNDDDQMQEPLPCDDPTNEDCPNYDPCYNSLSTSADFKLYSSMSFSNDTFFQEYDTVFSNRTLRLVANNDGYNRYQWQIGSEVQRRSGKTVDVTFGGAVGWIPVTLYVSNTPDSLCYPSDTGRDSLTKQVYVGNALETMQNLSIMGNWRGYYDANQDELYNIEITPYIVNGAGTIYPASIIGLKNACLVPDTTIFHINVNPHVFKIPIESTYCRDRAVEGYGVLNELEDTLTIDYYLIQDVFGASDTSYHKFIGTKIP